MTKILPAILSHDLSSLAAQLKAAETAFTEAHIDFMDGVFVPTTSITAKQFRGTATTLKLEAHLMVSDPLSWIEDLAAAHFKRILVHQEIGSGLVGAVHLINSLGLESGIVINPDSDPALSRDWWGEVAVVQVMGVIPGHYGASFQPQALEKLRWISEQRFSGTIQIDGAVTPDSIPTMVRAGARSLVVGSYLFGSEEAPQLDKIGEKLADLRTALGTH